MSKVLEEIAPDLGNMVGNTLKRIFSGEGGSLKDIFRMASEEVNQGFKKMEERKALEADLKKQLPDGNAKKDS